MSRHVSSNGYTSHQTDLSSHPHLKDTFKQQEEQNHQQYYQQENQPHHSSNHHQQQQQQQPSRKIDKRWRRSSSSQFSSTMTGASSSSSSSSLAAPAESTDRVHHPVPPLPEEPLPSSLLGIDINQNKNDDTKLIGECDMPTLIGHFRMRGYRSHYRFPHHNNRMALEPVVVTFGDIKGKDNVIVRVYDQCLTSEVFGSLRCDCREQLQESLQLIKREGGIVIYLQQEGRGIGIANKIAAYSLQDNGMDTVDANTHLGFKEELREYHSVKDILNDLNIPSIRLVTNNPYKIEALRSLGVVINERIAIEIPENSYNRHYLKSKRDRMNHLIMCDDNNDSDSNSNSNSNSNSDFNSNSSNNRNHDSYNNDNNNDTNRYYNPDRDIKDNANYEVEREEKIDIFDFKGGHKPSGYVFGKESVEQAIESIRQGKIVLVVDDEGRENEGDLILAAELATPETVGFMVRYTSGVLCVSMESDRLDELKLPPMVVDNEDPKETAYAITCDYKHGTTTGISAADRAATFRALANESCTAGDFQRPGHVFPLRYKAGGVLTRAGHTEATIDLVRLAGLKPIGVLSEVVNDDGSIKKLPDLRLLSTAHPHGI